MDVQKCDENQLGPGRWGAGAWNFHAGLLREYELSLMSIDANIEGLPYWNWSIDLD